MKGKSHNNKIKPILPSLREKKRYLAFEVLSEEKIPNPQGVIQAIQKACQEYLGAMGMANAGIIILQDTYNKDLQRGIIRVSNKMVDHLRAALCFVKEIDNKKVIVRSVGVSGILKKAKNRYLIKK
jgi:ribonuclease P/MRP protein subunit POP5